MKDILGNMSAKYFATCVKSHTRVCSWVRDNASLVLLIIGFVLLSGGLTQLSLAQDGTTFSEAEYDPQWVRFAVGNLFKLIEGPFGALIMVISGLGAIVAAAMGAYKAAVGMLVVAVGAFILRSLVSLFFGTNFEDYGDIVG